MSYKIPKEHIAAIMRESKYECIKSENSPCTVVIMTLPNGYALVESSGCIDPKEYDHELGIKLCKEALKRRVWQLEGYLGKQAFYEAEQKAKFF